MNELSFVRVIIKRLEVYVGTVRVTIGVDGLMLTLLEVEPDALQRHSRDTEPFLYST